MVAPHSPPAQPERLCQAHRRRNQLSLRRADRKAMVRLGVRRQGALSPRPTFSWKGRLGSLADGWRWKVPAQPPLAFPSGIPLHMGGILLAWGGGSSPTFCRDAAGQELQDNEDKGAVGWKVDWIMCICHPCWAQTSEAELISVSFSVCPSFVCSVFLFGGR